MPPQDKEVRPEHQDGDSFKDLLPRLGDGSPPVERPALQDIIAAEQNVDQPIRHPVLPLAEHRPPQQHRGQGEGGVVRGGPAEPVPVQGFARAEAIPDHEGRVEVAARVAVAAPSLGSGLPVQLNQALPHAENLLAQLELGSAAACRQASLPLSALPAQNPPAFQAPANRVLCPPVPAEQVRQPQSSFCVICQPLNPLRLHPVSPRPACLPGQDLPCARCDASHARAQTLLLERVPAPALETAAVYVGVRPLRDDSLHLAHQLLVRTVSGEWDEGCCQAC
eukprot:3114754-Rhodomonas_salina.1